AGMKGKFGQVVFLQTLGSYLKFDSDNLRQPKAKDLAFKGEEMASNAQPGQNRGTRQICADRDEEKGFPMSRDLPIRSLASQKLIQRTQAEPHIAAASSRT